MSSPPRLEGRVFVIGDVHAEDETLASALRYADTRGAKGVLCVGDIADGRGDLTRTLELLVEHEVDCVEGNHDRWALAGRLRQLKGAHQLDASQRAFLDSLPRTRLYETPLGLLLLAHGVAGDDMAHFASDTELEVFEEAWLRWPHALRPAVRFHVAGHTHEAMVRRLHVPGLPMWALNAGTLRVRPGRKAKLLELDLDAAHVEILEHDLGVWRPLRRWSLAPEDVREGEVDPS